MNSIVNEQLNKHNPKVSIIVPVYNVENYLEQCVNSLIFQSYKELEIILVDDGAKDKSGAMCDSFREIDPRIVVIHQNNMGLSGARNTGMEAATGELICFIDSDDWLDTDAIRIAIENMSINDADVVIWPYVREYDGKSLKTLFFGEDIIVWKQSKETLFRRMVGPCDSELKHPETVDSPITAWGKLYRREMVSDLRFIDTKTIGTEDALFTIEAFSRINVAVYLPYPFSHYRKTNKGSLTKKYKANLANQWKELHIRINEVLQNCLASNKCYEALDNRIALRAVGLGLNIISADDISFRGKVKELRNVLGDSFYHERIKRMELSYMPFYWKMFYLCIKYKCFFLVELAFLAMTKMFGKV